MNYFFSCLRFNLSLALSLTLPFGLIQTARLLLENRIRPREFLNLALFLTDQTVTAFLLTFLGTALALALAFGIRRNREMDASRLLRNETLAILVVVTGLIVAKRFFSDFLPPGLTYLAFYTSHWTNENLVLFAVLLLTLFSLSLAGPKLGGLSRAVTVRGAVCFLVLFLLLKGIAFAVETKLQGQLVRRDAPNVILLTVDTLRADHLSSFGYPRETTPNLDRLARESVLFTQALAPWPKTNQSFAGLLTGQYSYATGMGFRLASFLPRRNFLMSEVLKNQGYLTAGIVSNANLSRYFNFADGFDDYYELWRRERGPARERGWYGADRVTEKAVGWLEKNRAKKFFLWVQYIDPQPPKKPPNKNQQQNIKKH